MINILSMIISFLLRCIYPSIHVVDFENTCKTIQNMACLSTVLFATYAIYTDSDICLLSAIQYVKYFSMIDLLLCS